MKTIHSCNHLIFSQLCQMTRVHDWCNRGVTERAPKVHLDPADSHKTAKLRPMRFSRQRPVDTHSGQEKVSHILRFGALNLSLCRPRGFNGSTVNPFCSHFTITRALK